MNRIYEPSECFHFGKEFAIVTYRASEKNELSKFATTFDVHWESIEFKVFRSWGNWMTWGNIWNEWSSTFRSWRSAWGLSTTKHSRVSGLWMRWRSNSKCTSRRWIQKVKTILSHSIPNLQVWNHFIVRSLHILPRIWKNLHRVQVFEMRSSCVPKRSLPPMQLHHSTMRIRDLYMRISVDVLWMSSGRWIMLLELKGNKIALQGRYRIRRLVEAVEGIGSWPLSVYHSLKPARSKLLLNLLARICIYDPFNFRLHISRRVSFVVNSKWCEMLFTLASYAKFSLFQESTMNSICSHTLHNWVVQYSVPGMRKRNSIIMGMGRVRQVFHLLLSCRKYIFFKLYS